MSLKSFFQDSVAIQLGLWAGKTFSLSTLRKLAKLGGKLLSLRQKSDLIRSIKANQWVVSGETMNKEELKDQTLRVTTSQVTSLFEYFYYYQHPEEGKSKVRFTPEAEKAIIEIRDKKVPTFILGPHIGNFDFFMMALRWFEVPLYVLTYPNPTAGYKAQNELRASLGAEVHPLSFSSFRGAKQALKNGIAPVTGLDRPLDDQEDTKYAVTFFGRPAVLPTFYSRLCLDNNAFVRVLVGSRQEDGSFEIDTSEAIKMDPYPDPIEEVVRNVEKVLKPAEDFIRKYASDWSMFYPVWRDVFPKIEDLL